MTLAPEVEGGVNLIKELVARGWVASVGHTRAGLDTLEAALGAGARHMTHFLNAMSPLHHREPGPIGWGLVRDDVTVDLIADGVHSAPLMLRLVLRCKTPARVSLISDAVAPAGLRRRRLPSLGRDHTRARRAHEQRAREHRGLRHNHARRRAHDALARPPRDGRCARRLLQPPRACSASKTAAQSKKGSAQTSPRSTTRAASA
jgi:hypothetical protein